MTRRLLAVFVGLTLLVLLVHDIPLAAHLRSVERDRVTTSMERDAFTLAGLTEEAIEGASAGDAAKVAEVKATTETYGKAARSAISIYSAKSRLLVQANQPTKPTTPPQQSVALALAGVRNSGTRRDANGTSTLYVSVPILSGPRTIGAVELVRPASEVDERANTRLRGIAVAAFISLLLAAGLGWILARTLTEPLRRLRRTTSLIARGQVDSRAEVPPGPPEIRALAQDFNTMVDQLERVMQQQRDFTGDVSHQLRTPLTTMQLRLEQILAMVPETDAARAPLESANGELRRLSRTVEGLLAIARSDQSGAPIVDQDVATIVRQRCESWEPLIAEAGVLLRCDIAPSLHARAVTGAIEECIDNYVDNALEVSPANSVLSIRVFRDGENVVCEVRDEGPGLSDDDLNRAFDRFWRGEHSSPGGHGVGLAVVQRLAQASRGHASLAHAGGVPFSGISATLRLQASQPLDR